MKKVTIKSRVEDARQIIDRNFYDIPFNPSDAQQFNEVLLTEYQGFMRKRNFVYPSDTRHVYKFDGVEWKDFSWRQCIQPITETQRVKRTMREIVAPDLADFMASVEDQSCARCGSPDYPTVDHMDTSFDAIANVFIDQHGLPELVEGEHGVGFIFKDINLEAEWITHHAGHANYQILCRSCNASKGKR